MSQVTNLAFFRARSGQSEALGAAIWSLGEALGAFSIAPTSGTHEQDKERVYEHTQF